MTAADARNTMLGYDVARLRADEFPWMDSGESIYLNAASTGPLPARSVRAQHEFTLKRAAPHRLSQDEQFGVLSDSRERIARLVGANVGEIALSVNTGSGINLAAWAGRRRRHPRPRVSGERLSVDGRGRGAGLHADARERA